MKTSRTVVQGKSLRLWVVLSSLFLLTGWCNAQESYSELLKSAVEMAGGMRGGGFRLVRFKTTGRPGPDFRPIKGLDGPKAVPFLIDALENWPNWTDEKRLKTRGGMYARVGRSYAALCLGHIGDPRGFAPLLRALQRGDYPDVSEYAALALGYLGDPKAVEPLIYALQKDKREFAIFGLTQLRDIRAIKPIIEYASDHGRLDYMVHRCLEYISRARFYIKFSSRSHKYTVLDFPELGELESHWAHETLWQHLLNEGDRFARRQFEENYPKWKRLRKEWPNERFSQDRLLHSMVRGGVAVLPYLIDQIGKGDESLLLAVELVRTGGPFVGSSSRALTEYTTIEECLAWWAQNKQKWLIFQTDK